MEHQHGAGQEQSPDLSPERLLFEGSEQHTVEILPHVERLSTRARERSVIAGIGEARVSRRVGEGAPPAAVATIQGSARADELLAVTYQIAGFFTLVIVGVIIATAVAIFITSSVAT